MKKFLKICGVVFLCIMMAGCLDAMFGGSDEDVVPEVVAVAEPQVAQPVPTPVVEPPTATEEEKDAFREEYTARKTKMLGFMGSCVKYTKARMDALDEPTTWLIQVGYNYGVKELADAGMTTRDSCTDLYETAKYANESALEMFNRIDVQLRDGTIDIDEVNAKLSELESRIDELKVNAYDLYEADEELQVAWDDIDMAGKPSLSLPKLPTEVIDW